MTNRLAALSLALTGAVLATGCVIAPNSNPTTAEQDARVAKMSEQAIATCGAGLVKEVNAKSFTCK